MIRVLGYLVSLYFPSALLICGNNGEYLVSRFSFFASSRHFFFSFHNAVFMIKPDRTPSLGAWIVI